MSLSKTSPLLIIAICSLLAISSCTAPVSRGWSGAMPHGDNVYIGSMEGKVLALNSSARSQDLPFPAQGEWVFTTRALAQGIGFTCSPPPPPAIYGTPTMAGELVYVGNYPGRIYALYATAGQKKWVYPDEGSAERIGTIVGEVLVAEDKVYFGSSEGVYALDATYGKLKWHFKTGGKVWTSLAIKDKVILASSFDGKLYALSSDEGKELWHFEVPVAIASPPVVWADNVLFGAFDSYLHCIRDGREKWKFEGGNWFWARPLVSDGIAYAGCLDGKVYALEIETGEKLWEREIDNPIVSSPVLVEDFLVVASETSNLYIINAHTSEIVKTISLKSPVMAPLYEKEGIVYVHAKNRYLYAVKVPEGEIVWKFYLAVKES